MREICFVTRVTGPLTPYADGYRSELTRLGYTPNSVDQQMWFLGQLNRWLAERELCVTDLTRIELEQFLAHFNKRGRKQAIGHRRFESLLNYLRNKDLLRSEVTTQRTRLDEILEDYHSYLVEQRNLAPRTIDELGSLARKFLSQSPGFSESRTSLAELTSADVNRFLLAETLRLTTGAAKNCVAQLRSLLRFLYIRGLIPLDLAVSTPPVAGWRQTRLPRPLLRKDVNTLLDSCDRVHPTGRRDYAILMVLARLGLRSAETAHLQLDDVDWRAGELRIRGKSRRTERLPIPTDVGEALVDYLRGRPQVESHSIFLTRYAPTREMGRAAISEVVREACRRIGIPPVGSHRLRHALATEMLRQGATLPEQ